VIVGNQASAQRAAPLFPEYLVDFLADEIDEFPRRRADVFEISPAVKAAILDTIVPAWRGKTLNDRVMAIMPEDVAGAQQAGVISGRGNITSGDGHIIINIPKVIAVGLEGILAEAEAALADLSPYEAAEFKKRPFLQGAIIALKATIDFARRFAVEAERQAALPSTSPERKAELQAIAAACRQVPAKPPRTFRRPCSRPILFTSSARSRAMATPSRWDDLTNTPTLLPGRSQGRPDYPRPGVGDHGTALAQALFYHQGPPVGPHALWIGYPTYQNVTIGGRRRTARTPPTTCPLWCWRRSATSA